MDTMEELIKDNKQPCLEMARNLCRQGLLIVKSPFEPSAPLVFDVFAYQFLMRNCLRMDTPLIKEEPIKC